MCEDGVGRSSVMILNVTELPATNLVKMNILYPWSIQSCNEVSILLDNVIMVIHLLQEHHLSKSPLRL